jgi:hypothetical protein
VRTLMRLPALVFCLLLATACDEESPLGPTVSRAERFTLSPGQAAAVRGTDLRIEFAGVSGDSRCPADVVCIQAGEAIVQLRVHDNRTSTSYELRTAPQRATVTHGSLSIELLDLQPYPFSTRQIQQSDYQATLTTR